MKILLSVFCLLASLGLALAQIPQIISIGPEEYSGANGRLSTITTDSKNQPHIVSDGGAMAYFYDKIGGAWRASSYNTGSHGSSQYYEPHLEIDRNDIGWCSGSLFGGQKGLGFLLRTGMSTGPSGASYSQRNFRPTGGMMGNLSLDIPKNEAVSWASERYWATFVYNPGVVGKNSMTGNGQMYCGVGGEANSLWVSRTGMKNHGAAGTHSIWHIATSANSGYGMSYAQNSLRFARGEGSIAWANPAVYYGMGHDGCHVRIVGDNKLAETAYTAVDLSNDGGIGGVWGNVVDGTSAVKPIHAILCLDRTGSSGLRRYAPDMAPAKNGGAFYAWQNGGRVKIRYVSQRAEMGPIIDVGAGTRVAITCDSQGNIHVAYYNNGIRYRKILVAGGSGDSTLAGDFVGDLHNDLCVFDSSTRIWYIYSQLNPALTRTFRWGPVGSAPVPGNFVGGAKTDLAAFDSTTATWYIYDIESGNTRAVRWGYAGVTPLVADFIGDAHDDLVVYDAATLMWYIYDVQTGRSASYKWGTATSTPVPGNFVGKSKDDLAVYDSATFIWHIYDTEARTSRDVKWGVAGGTAIGANYLGDTREDLAVYDVTGGKWYIQDINSRLVSASRTISFGFAGAIPVRGNYYDTAANELSLFNSANGRWYIYNLAKGVSPVFGNITWGTAGMTPIGSAN